MSKIGSRVGVESQQQEPELTTGRITRGEIDQQFALWPDTVQRARAWSTGLKTARKPLFTGAGTSAYAASAIAGAWPDAVAVPTTDLLLDASRCPGDCDAIVSIARSGLSPESAGAVNLLLRQRPAIAQYAVTCNVEGGLFGISGVDSLLLDPRTNDRALAMTSSFSNLVLAGLGVRHSDKLTPTCLRLAKHGHVLLQQLEGHAMAASETMVDRAVFLASASLMPLAREAALKLTELTAGAVAVLSETFLGLRHGPMSYLREGTITVCYLSSDPHVRRYELDLIEELRNKGLGRIVCVGAPDWVPFSVQSVPALAPDLPDTLRTPFEVVFAQLLAFFFSQTSGLDPDAPSPSGVIHRVVQGVRLYES